MRIVKNKYNQIILIGLTIAIVFSLGFGAIVQGGNDANSAWDNTISDNFVGPRVISSSGERVLLSLTSPAAQDLLSWTFSPLLENKNGLGEITLSAEVGLPQLPVYRSLVGIPPDVGYDLLILDVASDKLETRLVLPSAPVPPSVVVLDGNSSLPSASISAQEVYPNLIYPDAAVKIVDEAWIRDQRVVVVEFYPLQATPGDSGVVYHPSITAEIRLVGKDLGNAYPLEMRSLESQASDIYDRALSHAVINYSTAKDWQAFPDALPFVHNFPIADGTPGLKIMVDHAGIYQITYDDLVAAGMNLIGINPAYLKMQNLDSAVAYEFLGDVDTLFEPGESIRFYGEPLPAQRLETLYQEIMASWISICPRCDLKELFENFTNENAYWLYLNTTPGERIQAVNGTPTDTFPVPEVFTDTRYAEQDLLWFSYHFTSSDTWFWNQAAIGSPGSVYYEMPITLGVVADTGPEARIKGEIYSRLSGDHHSLFTLNATQILDSYWSGIQRYVFTQTVPLSTLQDGQNLLGWETLYYSKAEDQRFDRYQIEYSHKFVTVNDCLAFNYPLPGSWQYEATGLSSNDAVVYDVTNPLQPVRVQGVEVTADGASYRAAFEVTQTGPIQAFVTGLASVEAPKSIDWYQPPELEPAEGADYVFITHHDFLAPIQTLADYRQSQGMRTVVVDVADIYDQFNYGIYHPIAIRNYLERAMLTWPGAAPQYVLLVGDGSFEIRPQDNIYVDEPNYIPPTLAITDPWQGEIDSSSLLAAVIGTDIVPDLAIGRLPVKTAEDINNITAKTIAYEQAGLADWQRKTVFIADNQNLNDSTNFEESADYLALKYTPPGFEARKYFVTDYCVINTSTCPEITNAILTSLNTEGATFVNYIGHGYINAWAGLPTVIQRSDIDSLVNSDRLPVVLSWTCLDGFFNYPVRTDWGTRYSPSLAENWLLASGKGAVALFSPSGLGVGTGHDILASGFYDSIFLDGDWNLGAASLAAKLRLYNTGIFLDLISSYSIFGDPALQLASPYGMQVSPEIVSGTGDAGDRLEYKITIQNNGLVEDNYLVAISGNTWSVSAPAAVGPVTAGSQVTFSIIVDIPTTASSGDADEFMIEVRSLGDANQADQVNIKSVVANAFLYLPLIHK